jgi:hypothetical protein
MKKSIKHYSVLILGLTSLCLAGDVKRVKLVDDPPLPAPKAGALKGRISPAAKIRTLKALNRATDEEYEPTTFDAKTGRFTFADLPGDSVYDICITTTDGRDVEGIDLSFVDARLERLAKARRKQLNLPAAKSGAFTQFLKKDADAILQFVADWKDFMDTRRVLYVKGRGDKAVVLVELMRLQKFYEAQKINETKLDIVWRIELWYFVRQGGGWERLPNVERVLRRVRAKPGEWETVSVEYDPKLSMAIDENGKSQPLTYTISAKPDPAKGRPAHTPAKLDTKPNVSGVDEIKYSHSLSS